MGDEQKSIDEILIDFIYKKNFFNKLVSFKGLENKLEMNFYDLNNLEHKNFENLNLNGLFKNSQSFEYKTGSINKEILPNSIFYIEDGSIKFIQEYEKKPNGSVLITETYFNENSKTEIIYENISIYNESSESYPKLTAKDTIFYDVILEKIDKEDNEEDDLFEEYLEDDPDDENYNINEDSDDDFDDEDIDDMSPCDGCEFKDWDENENLGLNDFFNNDSDNLILYIRSNQKFSKKLNDFLSMDLKYKSNGEINLKLKNNLGLELAKNYPTQTNSEFTFNSKIDNQKFKILAHAFNNEQYNKFSQICSEIFNKNENAIITSYNNQINKYKNKNVPVIKALDMMIY